MEDQIMIFAVDMEAALWKTNGQKFGFWLLSEILEKL